MVFGWIKEHRRNEILAKPFPSDWVDTLKRDVASYNDLTIEEQTRLQDMLRLFMAEKSWEGCGGLNLTDEMKVVISAQACLLILAIEHETYENVESILVYPDAFVAKQRTIGPDGTVSEAPIGLEGEAWRTGPVIISWMNAYHDGINPADGHNVVLHEFAHKLDLRDGSADGVPRLGSDSEYDTWAEVMSAEYADLVSRVEHGHKSLLDAYGATDAAEFFAVATECFFEKSVQMRETHPRLYQALQNFYKQDPAARIEARKSERLSSSQQ